LTLEYSESKRSFIQREAIALYYFTMLLFVNIVGEERRPQWNMDDSPSIAVPVRCTGRNKDPKGDSQVHAGASLIAQNDGNVVIYVSTNHPL
jgi:hypothetical protein